MITKEPSLEADALSVLQSVQPEGSVISYKGTESFRRTDIRWHNVKEQAQALMERIIKSLAQIFPEKNLNPTLSEDAFNLRTTIERGGEAICINIDYIMERLLVSVTSIRKSVSDAMNPQEHPEPAARNS
jgi:hypothetical protein